MQARAGALALAAFLASVCSFCAGLKRCALNEIGLEDNDFVFQLQVEKPQITANSPSRLPSYPGEQLVRDALPPSPLWARWARTTFVELGNRVALISATLLAYVAWLVAWFGWWTGRSKEVIDPLTQQKPDGAPRARSPQAFATGKGNGRARGKSVDALTASPGLLRLGGQMAVAGQPMRQPEQRLASVGSSYVVPDSRVARHKGSSVFIDIPSSPEGVWSLRAVLLRPKGCKAGDPWTRLELMVKFAGAEHHRLLLSCAQADEGDPSGAGPRLCIRGGCGEILASVAAADDGTTVLLGSGRPPWELSVHPRGPDPWLGISSNGELIAQAQRRGRYYRGSALQVDMQQEPGTEEAGLTLAFVLAALVFRPEPRQ